CLLCAYGYNSMLALTYLDSTGHLQSKTVVRDQTSNGSFFYPYYASLGCQYNYFPNDTLVAVPWKKWGCNIGYVNMGMMNMNDIRPMYSELQHTDAIIFDVRNYPISNADRSITSLMYSQDQCFANLTVPDTSYPGTFLPFLHDSAGNSGNASPYNGQAIILMDWETQSGAEWDCMMLSKLPHAIKVGSQTAGTDGNTTAFYLSTDIYTGFTAMGVYYCNGDSTERIGIVPDIVSYPTQQGVRQHRDEVLEKALQIANCPLGIKEIQKLVPEVSVYPNPSSGMIQVVGANLDPGKAVLKIMDLSGRKMQEINMETGPEGINKTIDVSGYKPGMYFLEVRTETKQMVVKVVKD
ncbi:MAG TPA: T9SS type A sorting domain-containing protein, partial [Bacteroidia bacterium]|nr:T9SS type A sorting domain-containing protein [Bacteroidia bacterium]